MREAGFEVETISQCTSGLYGWRSATSPGRNGRVAMKLSGLYRLADYWAIMAAPAVGI